MESVNTVLVTGTVYCWPVPRGPGLFRMTVLTGGRSQIVAVEMDHRTSRMAVSELSPGTEVQVIGQLVTRRVEAHETTHADARRGEAGGRGRTTPRAGDSPAGCLRSTPPG